MTMAIKGHPMFFSRIFLITVFLTGFFLAVQPAEAVKPMAPLEVSLELGGTPQVGGEVPVILRLRSMVDAPLVKIRCILPKGVERVSGQDTWEGEMVAGALKELTLMIKIKEPGQHILRATAMIEYAGGANIGQGTSLSIEVGVASEPAIGIESRQKAKPEKKEPTIRKGKDGQEIREFSLD